MATRPFTWIESHDVRGGYVDPVHNLRLMDVGGPDYLLNIKVLPPPGTPCSPDWPEHCYFACCPTGYDEPDVERFTISWAKLYQHFKRDFPGRSAEFVDSILPLLEPGKGRLMRYNYRNAVFDMPPMLRTRLLERGRYSAADERDQTAHGLTP